MDTTTRVFPSETDSTSNKETEMPLISNGKRKGAEDSASSKNGDHCKRRRQGPDIIIKIVSANYGPCEGLRLPTGELTNDEMASIPVTRDVAPFLRALLVAARIAEDQKDEPNSKRRPSEEGNNDYNVIPHIVRVSPTTGTGGMAQSFIYLLGGDRSMNAIFGDPCPGMSKRLYMHYVITEASSHNDDAKSLAAKTEVHHVSFFEHEHVVLRRRLTFYQDDSQLKEAVVRSAQKSQTTSDDLQHPLVADTNADETTLQQARQMGRSQSIADFAEANPSAFDSGTSKSSSRNSTAAPTSISYHQASPKKQWRLRSAVSEIVLPIVLPFLDVRERVQCRLICKSWKYVVRDWGVATTIDRNDIMIANFTRPYFRGILSHSFSSLHSLFLSGFEMLEKEDLHPSIPQLRKLRSLDVSRCYNLDDSTLQLLAQHVHPTLEVLYIKGLRKVTDVGMKAICDACIKLEVLEISNVPLTDEGGMAIQKLIRLRALFTRDNYQLTNKSIDVITEKCTRLAQLVLWGSTRLNHLSFDTTRDSVFSSGKLVVLNLWGCFNLRDEAAHALGNMKNLRSLIVSECHRLTDQFVISIASTVSQLNHLHLRYCKRITDMAINAITRSMSELYSLDLSFCSRVTASSIFNLLEIRFDCLTELRLMSCNNLDIVREHDQDPLASRQRVDATRCSGRVILNAIGSHADHCLCILDVRECGGQPSPTEPYPDSDPFVEGMRHLQFEQRVPGFFSRPTRWNAHVQRRLVEQIVAEMPS